MRLLGPSNSLRRNWAALLVAVPWALLASIRLLSLDRVWPLVPMVSFTPQVLAAVAIPLVIALLLRARYVAIGVTIAAAVLAVMVLPRTVTEDQPAARGKTITLMTANLLAGSSANDGIERIVRANDVDVLAMQEVTPIALKVLRDRGLTELLPFVIDETRPTVQGNTILSRWPLRYRNPREENVRHPSPEATIPRAGLIVRSIHPFPPFKPSSTNAWEDALRQMPAARERASAGLRVLMGDFNATLDHREFRAVVAKDYRDAGRTTGNGLVPTWSANRVMKLTIDHVLVDSRIAVLSYKTYNLPRSDHDAVVVKIRLP